MKGKITKVGLAIEYRKKYGMEMPTRQLAKIMYSENEKLFLDLEDSRWALRYLEGKVGKKNKKNVAEKQFIMEKPRPLNPYNLPESDANLFKPYKLPKANNNILFLSDIHLPYHNIDALTLALDYGKSKEVNTIYLNGDIMDFYQVSFHEKDPSQRNIEYEFDTMRSFLDLLKKNLPQCKIFYKEGNHEQRWERYLRQNAAAVSTMKEFRLDVLLNLRERGVEFIRNKQLVQAGKLNMIHGNEYKGGGGINVARTLWLRAGDNVIAGDKHKTQSGLKTNIDKSIVGTWSVGCLCDTNMDYLPFNEHNLGFAHIIVEPNGMFQVNNYSIINGKIV